MINKLLIYLSYHSYTIVRVLFALSLLIISVIGFIFGKPITGLLSFIFFFFLGLYLGFWLLRKIMMFLEREDIKENTYLQSLLNTKKSYRKTEKKKD
ncbi:MAG: hypothetical protein ACP5PZ_12250 [Bacteroidales bacterium]